MHGPPSTHPLRGAQAPPSQSPAGHLKEEGLHTPDCRCSGYKRSSASPHSNSSPVTRRGKTSVKKAERARKSLKKQVICSGGRKAWGTNSAIPACSLITSGPCQGSIRKPPWAFRQYWKNSPNTLLQRQEGALSLSACESPACPSP